MSKPSELKIASVISTGNSPILQSCCILLKADAQIQSPPLYIIEHEWSSCVVLENVALPVQCCREKIRLRPEIATPPLFEKEKDDIR